MVLRHQRRGFSLIELLLVISLMAVIIAIATPSVSNVIQGLKFKQVCREAISSLQKTRMRAISTHQETQWSVSLKKNSGHTNQKGVFNKPDNVDIAITTTAEQISSAEQLASITFFPDGSSTGGYIYLTQASQAASIQLNWLTGQLKFKLLEAAVEQ